MNLRAEGTGHGAIGNGDNEVAGQPLYTSPHSLFPVPVRVLCAAVTFRQFFIRWSEDQMPQCKFSLSRSTTGASSSPRSPTTAMLPASTDNNTPVKRLPSMRD
jgi:hypothetical protein